MNNTQPVNEKTIEPVAQPKEMPAIMKINDGKVTFHHPNTSNEFFTYESTIDELFADTFSMVFTLLDKLDTEFYTGYGFIVESILRDGKRSVLEAAEILKRDIGNISFYRVGQDAWPYRYGRVLTATLKKPA